MDVKLQVEPMNEPLDSTAWYAMPCEPFEEVYRREYPRLVGVALALTGASNLSEDLVQDTMVKAFLDWRRVGRLDRPGAWCLRVLTNACRSWGRRHRVSERYVSRLRRHEPTVAGPSVEHVAFWTAVRRLPERPRQVVVLHYVGERTVVEIASILRVPEGTIKSDLARSRRVLLAELER